MRQCFRELVARENQAVIFNFLERLNVIHQARKAQRDKKPDFVADGGFQLYLDALDVVVAKLQIISKKSPSHQSLLLKKSFDATWKEKFKRNFYKFFVDRDICQDHGDDIKNYSCFSNGGLDEERDVKNANICYGESFAVAFLVMLEYVELQIDEKKGLESQFILELFLKFNSIITCYYGGENITKEYITSVNHQDSYEGALARLREQEKFGDVGIAFDCLGLFNKTFFAQGFNHQGLFLHYLNPYFTNAKSDKDSFERAVFDLCHNLNFHVHVAPDANGRSAILLAWFLSLSRDIALDFPIPLFWHRLYKGDLEEARDWSVKFLQEPNIATYDETIVKIATQSYLDERVGVFAKQYPSEYFLATILASFVLYTQPIRANDDLTIRFAIDDFGKEKLFLCAEDGDFLLSFINDQERDILCCDMKLLRQVIAQIKAIEIANLDQRNLLIAQTYLQKSLELDLGDDLVVVKAILSYFKIFNQKEDVSYEQAQLANKVAKKYNENDNFFKDYQVGIATHNLTPSGSVENIADAALAGASANSEDQAKCCTIL